MSGDYADLRALAEAATPGPWESLEGGDRLIAWRQRDDELGTAAFDYVVSEPMDNAADAAYIAAANPARILALLADLDAARGDVAALLSWGTQLRELLDMEEGVGPNDVTDEVADVLAERDDLAAKVEALTAEVERLRGGMAGAQENTRRAIANLTTERNAERAKVKALTAGGVGLIAAERARQIAKGYTTEHDAQHGAKRLGEAAVAYLKYDHWLMPWPVDAVDFYAMAEHERLVKAGALVAAALDALGDTP